MNLFGRGRGKRKGKERRGRKRGNVKRKGKGNGKGREERRGGAAKGVPVFGKHARDMGVGRGAA